MRHVHYLVHYLLVLEYRFYQPKHEIFRLREALVYILTTLLRPFVTSECPAEPTATRQPAVSPAAGSPPRAGFLFRLCDEVAGGQEFLIILKGMSGGADQRRYE